MQENRSFDHYFGQLPAAEDRPPPRRLDPDPRRPADRAIPPEATLRGRRPQPLLERHPRECDGGAMDGFTAGTRRRGPRGARAMGSYTKRDLPFYNELYKTFAIGDRYFSSVLGQTFPNRYYLLAGTSFGHIRNDSQPRGRVPHNSRSSTCSTRRRRHVEDLLLGSPFAALFSYVRKPHPSIACRSGSLTSTPPPARYRGGLRRPGFLGRDRRTTSIRRRTSRWVRPSSPASTPCDEPELDSTRRSSSPTTSTAATPTTCPTARLPAGRHPAQLQPGDVPGAFDRYGFRVPVVVVSPSPERFVSPADDHTSILRFIETRFDLPALTRATPTPTRCSTSSTSRTRRT